MPQPPRQRPPRFGLARALSKRGVCSRAQAEQWVIAGRIGVNGQVVRDPEARVDPERDRFTVDGAPVAAAEKIYLMMNKPRGLVTTASDERGRATVYSLLGDASGWIAPIGRLDKASEGLLLFSNDTVWAARLLDPASHLDKTYHVQIDTIADAALTERLTTGVDADGERLSAKSARLLRAGERHCWLEIVLDEGRNRQIRRLLEALGIRVLRLVRVAIGPLVLGELAKSQTRPLTQAEKAALDAALSRVATRSARPPGGRRPRTTPR